MKKLVFSAALLLSLAAFSTACKQKTENAAAETPAQTVADGHQCPMKCEGEKTYEQPGKCPVCEMEMKKVADKGK